MKVIVLKNNLKEILSAAERLTGENLNLPILKNVLLRANESGLAISATNLEIGVSLKTSAKVIEPGVVVVPAQLFSSVISNFTSERINLEKKSNILEIKADNYEAEIPTSSTDEFPIIPKIENQDKGMEISALVIGEAISRVSGAVQISDFRPEISGVFFDFSIDNLTLVGTDSFRLAEKRLSRSLFSTNQSKGFKLIIPLRTAQEIGRVFKKDEVVKFFFDENQVMVVGSDCELISRLTDGNFPDYHGIIPKEFETKVEIEKEEMISALKLSGSVSQMAPEVKISVKEGKKSVEVLSAEKNFGKTKSMLPAKISGKPQEVLFNWRYLLEGLRGFSEKTITLGLNGDAKPAMMKSDDNSYLYLLMPVKQ